MTASIGDLLSFYVVFDACGAGPRRAMPPIIGAQKSRRARQRERGGSQAARGAKAAVALLVTA
ncbi:MULTISPECIES: hypothetical protein [Burkholderia]|uniref:hypothetical protein n=1 Tax=Burkholderia TaxID=32008 RepID=UPI0002F8ECE8|nr:MULTISPECIES: hypothetical protein [Burkholderia]MCA8184664.1 hypothetical protein [Burkholderia vietnamiensis]MCA8199363.1 hypothetical protein [Burkholderia vietnamiensis]MCA8270794.1 hypothetical protein [Burkholderia vietnamiensis]MCB4346728.1 hypothetical protein [Burkholderia vietnamiensis]MDN7667575.1 hypothetical protein [Burkholderia vietnamiensis]